MTRQVSLIMPVSLWSDIFSFRISGRSPRKHYWIGMLVFLVLSTLVEAIWSALWGVTVTEEAWVIADTVLVGAYLLLYVLLCCLTVRRLHDIGRSGWWILFFFVPLLGWFANLVLGFLASSEGSNRYGPHPYGQQNIESSDKTVELLERLAQLHRQGDLSDAEYAAEKARVLGK